MALPVHLGVGRYVPLRIAVPVPAHPVMPLCWADHHAHRTYRTDSSQKVTHKPLNTVVHFL